MTLRRSRQLSVRGRLALLCGIGLLCGASTRPQIPLTVEYSGCRAVLVPGPVCVLPPSRQLVLWVAAPADAPVEVRSAGRRMDVEGEPVQDGQRLSLTLPGAAPKVEVRVETGEGRAVWSLALAEPLEPGRLPDARDVLKEAIDSMLRVDNLIPKRQLGQARKILRDVRLSSDDPAESHFLAAFYGGLLAEKEGDYRSALTEMQKALEAAERLRLEAQRAMAEEKVALLLGGVGRWREAAQRFEHLLRTSPLENACEEARILNNQAWSELLAREAGEPSSDPTPLLERALQDQAACGAAAEYRINTLINLAMAHLLQDRLAQAKDLLAETRRLEPQPPLLHTLWVLDLEARIALREGRPAEALDLFDELEGLAMRSRSPDGRLRAAFGQARSYSALGDSAAALDVLRRAEALLDEQSLQIPLQEGRDTFMATRQALVSLHVEVLLDQRRTADALAVARHARSRMLRQLEHGDRLDSLPPERRELWDRLLAEYNKKRMALEERTREDWRLPADQLRREEAARKVESQKISALLDRAFLLLGGPAETEVLPPPRPGELILTWCRLSQGWVGFAADGATIAVHRFDLPPGALLLRGELAHRLLLPFRDAIEKAERIRVLPSGPLQGVDIHALPFAGDVLLASRPVVYGLDLPVRSSPARPAGRHALLVADPRDDLPGALAEARTVRTALDTGARPWNTEELRGAEASAETVRNRLAGADLLHYAGHGTFSGFGGWDSSLLLAGATRLTLGDLLALERVPSWVVLSGCDTGRSSTETPVESLGLAHAFLLAGSQAVVASVRPADDRAVPVLFMELYRQLDREADPAVAFQRAQLAWRTRNPGADWAAFRLFVP